MDGDVFRAVIVWSQGCDPNCNPVVQFKESADAGTAEQ